MWMMTKLGMLILKLSLCMDIMIKDEKVIFSMEDQIYKAIEWSGEQ